MTELEQYTALSPIRTVCFTGHRQIADRDALFLPSLLDTAISGLIARGAVTFRAGGARGFDTLAALKVLSFRERFPDLRLSLVLPCEDQDARWVASEQELYRYLLTRADDVSYVSRAYNNHCMMERNRRLVAGADVCLAYCNHRAGGTYYTCRYALEQGTELYNLCDHMPQNPGL